MRLVRVGEGCFVRESEARFMPPISQSPNLPGPAKGAIATRNQMLPAQAGEPAAAETQDSREPVIDRSHLHDLAIAGPCL